MWLFSPSSGKADVWHFSLLKTGQYKYKRKLLTYRNNGSFFPSPSTGEVPKRSAGDGGETAT